MEELEQQGESLELDELMGLDTVQQDIMQHVELLAQNPENKQAVKQYSDMLGQLNNMLKKFIQHYMEAKQAEDEKSMIDPEAQAKITTTQMLAEVKGRNAEMNAAQKRQQSQMKFEQQFAQKMANHEQKMKQAMDNHMLEMNKQMAELQASLVTQAATTRADIKATEAKAATATVGAEK